MDDDAFIPGVLTGAICVGIIAFAIWMSSTPTDSWHREAVSLGHAEFYLDAETQRAWRWKTNCTEAK